MSFHDVRFPIDLSFGFSGGPVFDVDITKTKSGVEQRNLNNVYPQATYSTPYNSRQFDDYQRILNFYYARHGKVYGFRYKDWKDFKAADQIIGHYTGAGNTFQLCKIYGDEGGKYMRKITKPVRGTVVIYVNYLLHSNFDIDYKTGIVTVNGLTGVPDSPIPITADFEFDVPVRFDNDFPTNAVDDPGDFISVSTIMFSELIGE